MSDTEQLFWILVALTVGFSCIWLRPGGVLFVSQFGERPRRRAENHSLLRNHQGCLLFGNFTPFGRALVASHWPVQVSPDGFAPVENLGGAGGYIPFADFKIAKSDGRVLLVNGRPFVTCQSATAAARWSARLTELATLPQADREASIRRLLEASLDPAEAERTLATCWASTATLRWVSRLLFAYCYAILGVLLTTNFPIAWELAIVWYCMLMLMTLVAFRNASSRLNPGTTIKGGWLLLISPAEAFRASDKLIRPRLEDMHPAALGIALYGNPESNPYVRKFKLELLHPLQHSATTSKCSAWFKTTLRSVVEQKLGGLELGCPEAEDGAVAYCPRCESQYDRDGLCSSCGIVLVAFTSQSNAPKVG